MRNIDENLRSDYHEASNAVAACHNHKYIGCKTCVNYPNGCKLITECKVKRRIFENHVRDIYKECCNSMIGCHIRGIQNNSCNNCEEKFGCKLLTDVTAATELIFLNIVN